MSPDFSHYTQAPLWTKWTDFGKGLKAILFKWIPGFLWLLALYSGFLFGFCNHDRPPVLMCHNFVYHLIIASHQTLCGDFDEVLTYCPCLSIAQKNHQIPLRICSSRDDIYSISSLNKQEGDVHCGATTTAMEQPLATKTHSLIWLVSSYRLSSSWMRDSSSDHTRIPLPQ